MSQSVHNNGRSDEVTGESKTTAPQIAADLLRRGSRAVHEAWGDIAYPAIGPESL